MLPYFKPKKINHFSADPTIFLTRNFEKMTEFHSLANVMLRQPPVQASRASPAQKSMFEGDFIPKTFQGLHVMFSSYLIWSCSNYDYQNLSPLANGTGLNRQKYAILQTHWH